MAAIIRIKRSTGTSAPGSLKTGELAYSAGTGLFNNGGDRLFFGKGDDGLGNATSVVAIGGEYFANLADHQPGTLTPLSALITDASNKIDVINVDNITIDGNTISSTDTNGNVVIDPNGSGVVDVSTSFITNVVDPVNPQDAATKAYVDAQNDAQLFTIIGDTGTDTVDLDDSDVTFTGDDWITTAVTDNTVTFTHDISGVVAGTYGSQTEIPVFTVDDRGHLDSAGTVPLATVLNTTADTGTGDIALLDSAIEIAGGTNIHTVAFENQIYVHMDSNVTNLSLLSVDQVQIDGSTIQSTAGNLNLTAAAEVVANTLTVSDLTDNRVVLAGTGGQLEDDANFTFDGSNLNLTAGMNITGDLDVDNINIDGNDITSTDVNGNVNITPNGTGEVVISTATVSDLTDNRIVLAGPSGSLEDDANFTFDGTNFNVTADQNLTGNLTVTGQADIDNIRINGNVISSTDGSNLLVIDPSPVGDSAGGFAGDLVIRGNLTVQGTQTIINSTTMSVNDLNIILADSAQDSASADGAGITVNGANANITYDAGTDRWDFNKGLSINGTSLDDAISIGGVNFTETLEDHFANNVFLGHDSSGQDITYDDGAGTITFSNQYASLTNVGTASFGGYTDSADAPAPGNNRQFSVSAKGDVTIVELDGGTY